MTPVTEYRHLGSLDDLASLAERGVLPFGHIEVAAPARLSCRLERRNGGLLAIEFPARTVPVQTGDHPPWTTRYPSTWFWNYSDHGGLWGSVQQGVGHFTRNLRSDATFPPIPSPMIVSETERHYMIQGVALHGQELSYSRILFPERFDRAMFLHFLAHLGLGTKPYTRFSDGRQALLALRHDWR